MEASNKMLIYQVFLFLLLADIFVNDLLLTYHEPIAYLLLA